jgi:hypothetical protein
LVGSTWGRQPCTARRPLITACAQGGGCHPRAWSSQHLHTAPPAGQNASPPPQPLSTFPDSQPPSQPAPSPDTYTDTQPPPRTPQATASSPRTTATSAWSCCRCTRANTSPPPASSSTPSRWRSTRCRRWGRRRKARPEGGEGGPHSHRRCCSRPLRCGTLGMQAVSDPSLLAAQMPSVRRAGAMGLGRALLHAAMLPRSAQSALTLPHTHPTPHLLCSHP